MTSEVKKCDSNAEKSSVAVVNDSLETILLGRRTHTCSIASGPTELGGKGGGKGGHLPHPILAYQLNLFYLGGQIMPSIVPIVPVEFLDLPTALCVGWLELAEAKIQFCKGAQNKRKEEEIFDNGNVRP